MPGSINTNKGIATLNGLGDIISWDVPQVATETIFLKYKIVADDSSVCGTQNPEDTVVKYENSNCQPVTLNVPSPDICVPCPTITPTISQQECSTFIDYAVSVDAGDCGGLPSSSVEWDFFLNNVLVGSSNQLNGTFQYTGGNPFTGTFKAVATFTGTYNNGCILPGIVADESLQLQLPPDAPTSTGDIIECEESPIQTLDANDAIVPVANQTIIWYDAPNGGSIVSNPIKNTIGSVTYYAASVITGGGCSNSVRTPVTLKIQPAPNAPASTGDITQCVQDPIQTLDANDAIVAIPGQTIVWYDAPSGGILVSNPILSAIGSKIYYAEAYKISTNCSSLTRTAVELTINPLPAVNAGNYGPFCNNAMPITLIGTPTDANGTWSGTGVVDNGDGTASFDPTGLNGPIAVTYNYTNAHSCENSDTTVITVNPAPLAPTSGGNQTECASTPIQTLTATATVPNGQTIVWYNQAVGGTSVSPTWNSLGSITYYAEAVDNLTNCSSSTRTAVTLTLNNCGIQLEKIASPNNPQDCNPVAAGETITYTFNISNPASNSPVYNVELRDPLIDPTNSPLSGPISGDISNPGILDAGETWVYIASYTVTPQDIINGQVQNTATISGLVQTTGTPFPVSASDTEIVNLCQNAEISIVKQSSSATGNCIAFEVGNIIDYEFIVTNEGDVDITDVVVNDPKLGGDIAGPASGDINNDGILNVGEAWIYNASYIVTLADINIGAVVNIATVNGNTALGSLNETSNTVTVLICQTASFSVIKSQTNPTGGLGDLITYDIVVTNTGNTTITNIEVTDANAVITGGNPIASLLPGAGATVTAEHTITVADFDQGYIENIAIGTGDSVNGTNDVSDTSDTGTDTNGNPIPNPETVETPNGDGSTNGDPTDDPTVTKLNTTVAVDDVNDTFVNIPVSGNVLTNDFDLQGDTQTVTTTSVTTVQGVLVTINPTTGVYTYVPPTNYVGEDSFIYTICDDRDPQACDSAVVYIEIEPLDDPNNNPPVANADTNVTLVNVPVNGNVLPNDYDPDGDPIIVTANTAPSNGSVVINPDGTYTYIPNANYVGQDTFTYTICDNGNPALCDTTIVTIQVIASTNNITTAVDDSYYTTIDVQITGNVLDNDTDPQGDSQTVDISISPANGPTNGNVVLNADGSFTYTPNTGYTGPDSFVYSIFDNGNPVATDSATVFILVGIIGNEILAIDDINDTFVNTSVSGDVGTNDDNLDGPAGTEVFTLISGPINGGTLVFNANGTYTYTPATDYIGEDSFVYQICDAGNPIA